MDGRMDGRMNSHSDCGADQRVVQLHQNSDVALYARQGGQL